MQLFVVLWTVFIGATVGVHVAVVPFPELGHFNPLAAVVRELLSQSNEHRATLFVVDFFQKHCLKEFAGVERATCKVFGHLDHQQYNEDLFEQITQLPAIESFKLVEAESWMAQQNITGNMLEAVAAENPDVILCDFGFQIAGGIVADVLSKPLVLLWPLLLSMPGINTNPRVPSLTAALPLRMSFVEYVKNAAVQRVTLAAMSAAIVRVNGFRAEFGLPPVGALSPYSDRVILTPSIFGLDVAQHLCPNVIPVGLLQSKMDDSVIPEDWRQWFNNCGHGSNGTVYINMGSIGRLPPRWVQMIEQAVMLLPKDTCVLWKISERQQKSLLHLHDRPRTRLSNWLPFSPRSLLKHQLISTFVTHCGDTSVYESVEFGVPLVGFPLFADQPDMCHRVQDAGLGVTLDKLTTTSEDMYRAITEQVVRFDDVQKRCAQLRNVSRFQGETMAASRVVLAVAELGTSPFLCDRALEDPIRFFDWDITALVVSVVLCVGYSLAMCARLCTRNH